MKISEALTKKSIALQSLIAEIANSHNLLQEYSEASVLSPSHYLKFTTSIMANEDAARGALATYGDIDLIALDQDELDEMAAHRAVVVAGMRNKLAGSDYCNAIETEEEATLISAHKFVSVISGLVAH